MVAKSFQNLKVVTEPYQDKGKFYVDVLTKKGAKKRVRWYTIEEYCKLYPDEDPTEMRRLHDPYYKPLKHTLMGGAGWIWVLEGDADAWLEELKQSSYTWYNTIFGWYMPPTTPFSIVEGAREQFIIHKVKWEDVADNENELKPDAAKIIDKICHGKATRKWK
jgi:hypothetical protein